MFSVSSAFDGPAIIGSDEIINVCTDRGYSCTRGTPAVYHRNGEPLAINRNARPWELFRDYEKPDRSCRERKREKQYGVLNSLSKLKRGPRTRYGTPNRNEIFGHDFTSTNTFYSDDFVVST